MPFIIKFRSMFYLKHVKHPTWLWSISQSCWVVKPEIRYCTVSIIFGCQLNHLRKVWGAVLEGSMQCWIFLWVSTFVAITANLFCTETAQHSFCFLFAAVTPSSLYFHNKTPKDVLMQLWHLENAAAEEIIYLIINVTMSCRCSCIANVCHQFK